MSDLEAVYRGYDDAALALLSNPGLVRRAGKLVGSARETGHGIEVGDVVVRLDAKGPAAARCPCPATGVCVHILAASMWVRDAAPVTSAPLADPLSELLGIDPAAVCREAGIAAVRRAKAYLESLSPELAAASAVVVGPRVEITVADLDDPIVYIAGAGLRGMVSTAPAAEQTVVHLAAVVRLFTSSGREWTWPAAATDAAGASFDAVHGDTINLLTATLGSLLAAGLSHVTLESSERLGAIAPRARAEGLPLLARLTASAAAMLAELADRRDDSSERTVAIALAQVWALAAALSAATPEQLPALTGIVRREFTESTTLDLLPLGALWWTSLTGTRGITAAVADRATGEIQLVTSARPLGVDTAFRQNRYASLLWSSTIDTFAAGPFRLIAPRRAADGLLAGGGGQSRLVRESGAIGFDTAELHRLARAHWPGGVVDGAASGGFGTPHDTAVLLAPASVGDVRIDEAAQQLAWPLVDADGAVLEVRVDVSPTSTNRIDALLALAESKDSVEFVLVHLGRRSGVRTASPSGVFVRRKGAAAIELLVLDFVTATPGVKQSRLQALRARLERMLDAPKPALVSGAASTLSDRICLPVLDVLEEIAATGRLVLTDRQRGILIRQATLAADVALTTVDTAIRALLGADPAPSRTPVTAPAFYRALFVIDRALSTPLGP